jgi:hypothetical protein
MSISRINRGNSIQRITGDASGVPNVITPRPATNLGNNLYEYVFPGTNSITFSNQVDPNTIQQIQDILGLLNQEVNWQFL